MSTSSNNSQALHPQAQHLGFHLCLKNPVQVLIILLTISHFTGCLWFAVGARDTSESTWVKALGYETQGVDAQYLASLHWALSQFLGC